jgi:hypothetical protein
MHESIVLAHMETIKWLISLFLIKLNIKTPISDRYRNVRRFLMKCCLICAASSRKLLPEILASCGGIFIILHRGRQKSIGTIIT